MSWRQPPPMESCDLHSEPVDTCVACGDPEALATYAQEQAAEGQRLARQAVRWANVAIVAAVISFICQVVAYLA